MSSFSNPTMVGLPWLIRLVPVYSPNFLSAFSSWCWTPVTLKTYCLFVRETTEILCFFLFRSSPATRKKNITKSLPIGSMYGIFTYIWLILVANVGKYTIHGSYGLSVSFFLWQLFGTPRFCSSIATATRSPHGMAEMSRTRLDDSCYKVVVLQNLV